MKQRGYLQSTLTGLKRKMTIYRALRILAALGIAILLYQFPFDYIESLFYDGRMRFRPTPAPSGNVALVSIDRQTYSQLNRAPEARDHLALLKAINEDRPAAVVYIYSPSDMKGAPKVINEWVNLTLKTPNFYIGVDGITAPGHEDKLRMAGLLSKVPVMSAPTTMDFDKFAQDSVTRRLLISLDSKLLLHGTLAALYNGILDSTQYQGNFEFLNSIQGYVNFRPTGTYQPLSFFNVAEKRFPRGTFTNKVVFIGQDSLDEVKDYVRTPYSRSIVAMTKLELHANMLDTLILNNSPIRSPRWIDLALTAIISLITVTVVWQLKPTRGLLILLTTMIGFSTIAFALFAGFNIWISMAHPLLAIFMSYYFFIPYRLIKENRRSWEYYQKNKLLTQVEELKTNFLSLMSHDLKTPLARIQGMADVALHDAHPLSAQQRVALDTISRSSEELSVFISSILNLSRVESQEVKLHLQPKDINTLIEELIRKFEYMAQAKNIQLVAELEPLFSFKMDVDLMKQVLSNLIENAIKYSAENSRVLITTEEVDGRVVVQVADQGIGIPASDLNNIFLKFYRSQDAKTSPTKGSGLGLYLAKYFVELHQGEISAESVYQQGSTFTIRLPMEH